MYRDESMSRIILIVLSSCLGTVKEDDQENIEPTPKIIEGFLFLNK